MILTIPMNIPQGLAITEVLIETEMSAIGHHLDFYWERDRFMTTAFLEALYFRKPIMVNTYSIYTKDLEPKGFLAIEFDGYATQAVVDLTKRVRMDPDLCHSRGSYCGQFKASA